MNTRCKLTKKESGYVPPFESIRCGTCKYYKIQTSFTGKCAIVDGKIHSDACCNLWTLHGKNVNTDFICGQDIEDILCYK